MKTYQNPSKNRILVVSDKVNTLKNAMDDAIHLAKRINGSIELLFIKSPMDFISSSNQVATIHEMSENSSDAKKALLEMVRHTAQAEDISITSHFAFGNVVNQVKQHLNDYQPDVVVIGKRKANIARLLGIDLTSYLLNNYNGALLISNERNANSTWNELALGILDDRPLRTNNTLFQDLERTTTRPITLFKSPVLLQSHEDDSSTVEIKKLNTFEFDSTADIGTSVPRYVERSGIGLLCVSKNNLVNINRKLGALKKQIHQAINNTNRPVLILNS